MEVGMKMKSHVLPKLRRSLLATLALVLAWPLAARAEPVSFKDDVFPILELRCLECHQPGTKGFEQSGLDLRTYEGLMTGTKHGPVVVPRSAFTSNLIVVVDHRANAARARAFQVLLESPGHPLPLPTTHRVPLMGGWEEERMAGINLEML